jgi:predicted flap endonuclease-1-like 5' DNA nuclease/predicted nuclease with TOPRIM domain
VAEAKLSEVVGDKKSLEDDLASIRGERDELKQSLEETSAEKGGLEVRVTELDECVTRTSDELDQLSIAKVELEGRVAEAQGEVAMVRMDMDLAQQEREAGREELEKRKVAEGKWADELHRLREEKKELNEHMAILAGDSKAEVLINQLKAEKERLMHDVEDQKRERQQVEDAAGVLRREMHGLRNELVDAEKRIGEIQEELVAAEERLSRTQADLKRTLEERKKFDDKVGELETVNTVSQETQRILADEIAELETAQKEAQAGRKSARTAERLARVAKTRTKPEPDPEPESTSKRSSAAADDLRASLATDAKGGAEDKPDSEAEDKPHSKSAPEVRAEQWPGSGEDGPAEKGLEDLEDLDDLGELEDLERAAPPPVPLQAAKKLPVEGDLYEDKRMGMLYRRTPAEIDDLTQLKGVGEVIRDRLQEAGIYTFRQVAAWRAPQVRAISEELKLRDRVKRDGWQKQARVLDKKK